MRTPAVTEDITLDGVIDLVATGSTRLVRALVGEGPVDEFRLFVWRPVRSAPGSC
ncbi:hypothetical protein I4I73_10755 [Pseudonocardia sp. KRD-184]|uniref:Uncharacterized protein n=1 Tax=Pseudonocardia oceani TaxID=2792013 RepID=A0ABS6U818_9PSEU|nr:hypothetical protein [Pseudonocardia oceani]MBW0089461.1 hypothetical protein [Pseudonocardia oceani]MBW0096467.1 hypothetical protein [Pseudonocardia oceani]MBW0109161.1 hypothetical protein [Pseudonocardia oceani]MBW0120686.1 hypothetical protein [Pseudonocardia oceani]MBW0128380.1 hypothetical protein [Pseudonocardia oceani]